MMCGCGGWMKPETLTWFGVSVQGRKCTKCAEETISSTQSKVLERKMRLSQALKRPRKVVQIGNSMGITIPEELKKIGFKVGKRVKTELIDEHSFKVEIE